VLKVACIGEQTTHSDLFPSRTDQAPGMQEYPAMLQTLLGSGYNVMNYGDCCASVIQGYTASETHPYVDGNQFNPSIAFAPDIVVIGSWGRHDWGMSAQNALAAFEAGDTATTFTKFQTDYDTLVSKYLAAASKPQIYCSTPIPIPFGNDGPDDGYKTSPAAAAVTAVCQKYNLPIIDLFTAFTGHKEFYINPPDKDSEGEHTSTAGATEIAQLVYEAITGADGGASIPAGDGGAGPAGNEAGAAVGGSGSSSEVSGSSSSGAGSAGETNASTSVSIGGSTSTSGGAGTGSTGAGSTATGTSMGANSGSPPGNSAGPGGGGCSIGFGVTGSPWWAAGLLAFLSVAVSSRRRVRRSAQGHPS
jgi:hypothetical protein